MNKKEGTILFSGILVILMIASFSAAAAELTVAVTIVPQIEMVQAITGERVEVVEMIPQGFSPSNYAPSPDEMRAFNDASIYFSMGVPADVQNILPRTKEMERLKVVKLFKEIEAKYPHRYFGEAGLDVHQNEKDMDEHNNQNVDEIQEHSHDGGRDPHIWLSPTRVKLMVEIMRDQLIEILPEYEKEFRENAKEYIISLIAADQKNKKLLEPYSSEAILVYHPSFGYFTDHYSLEMMAIEENGKEPGPRHLQEIIKNASKKDIKNVFYQAEIDSRKTRAVAEELGGKIIKLNPLAKDYIKNLKEMARKIEKELAKRDDQ